MSKQKPTPASDASAPATHAEPVPATETATAAPAEPAPETSPAAGTDGASSAALAGENAQLRTQLAQLQADREAMAAEIETLRDAPPAGAPDAPAKPLPGPRRGPDARPVGLRALTSIAIVLDGERRDLVAGEEFEAIESEAGGLVPGVHIELAGR